MRFCQSLVSQMEGEGGGGGSKRINSTAHVVDNRIGCNHVLDKNVL